MSAVDLELTPEERSIRYRKTRDLSIKEGAAASVMGGAGDNYVSPFAIEAGASNFDMGLLSSYSGLLGPIGQVLGSKLMEFAPRRRITFWAVIAQATVWIGFVLLATSFWLGSKPFWLVPMVILAYILYQLTGALAGPAWFSMLGEAVPEDIRGKYFSRRNRLSIAVSVSTTLLSSVLLYYARELGWLMFGFIILFAIASIARFVSAWYISRHYSAPISFSKDYHFSFWQFVKRAPFNNFGRFTIYVAVFSLAVNIAGPFFSVYMWKDLGFNPIWYTVVNSSLGFFSVLSIAVWGKFSDKYGNRELMKIGSVLIGIGSLLWAFTANPFYFIFVPELCFGLGWAAFNLATSNFIYDAVTPQRRGLCLAYYSLLNGVGVFGGALIGGFLAENITLTWMNTFVFIFVVSGIMRLLVSLIFLPQIKEVKTGLKPPKNNPFDYLTEDIIPNYLPAIERIHLTVFGRFRGQS